MTDFIATDLVAIDNGVPVTTSLAIAEGTDVQHASVIKLVREYQQKLERFGRVRFEIAPFETAGGTQSREIAILNERQATALITEQRVKPLPSGGGGVVTVACNLPIPLLIYTNGKEISQDRRSC